MLFQQEEVACTLLVKTRPVYALVAAAFEAQLGSTAILVSGTKDYSDIHPRTWIGCRTIIWPEFARDVLLGTCQQHSIDLANELKDLGHELIMLPQLEAKRPAECEDERFYQSFRTLIAGYFPDRAAAAVNLAHAADTLTYPEHSRPSITVRRLANVAFQRLGQFCIDRIRPDTERFTAEVAHLRTLAEELSS